MTKLITLLFSLRGEVGGGCFNFHRFAGASVAALVLGGPESVRVCVFHSSRVNSSTVRRRVWRRMQTVLVCAAMTVLLSSRPTANGARAFASEGKTSAWYTYIAGTQLQEVPQQ